MGTIAGMVPVEGGKVKIRFTIQSPVPLSFIAIVETSEDAWRLLGYLGETKARNMWPIVHEVLNEETYHERR